MFARFSVARKAVNMAQNVRKMSGNHSQEQIRAEVLKWKQYTFGMVVLSSVCAVYNYAIHDHHHQRDDLPYLKIRTKPYPWTCSDCNLFNGACWAECRGEVTESHDSHAH